MKATKLSVALVCALSALSAFCAAAPASHAAEITLSELDELSDPREFRVEPLMAVRHSDDSAESLYRLGRHHQQANRLEEAAGAYRAALQKDEDHIEARNALATIYFAQKDMIAAMSEFKTILQQRPGLSHVHSNLGYAYMLEENYAAAMPELAQAIIIDPTNARAFGNLTLAYERLGAMVKEGQARPAATAGAAAEAMQAGDVQPLQAAEITQEAQAVQTVQTVQTVQAVEEAVKAAQTGTEEEKKDGMAAVPARIELAKAEPQGGIAVVIANGTRDETMAGRIADGLRRNGVNVSRMTDLAPYRQQRTVILYRDGYRKEALELSRMFAVPPAVVNNTRTRDAADASTVRLVLGKRSAQADVRTTGTQLASAR